MWHVCCFCVRYAVHTDRVPSLSSFSPLCSHILLPTMTPRSKTPIPSSALLTKGLPDSTVSAQFQISQINTHTNTHMSAVCMQGWVLQSTLLPDSSWAWLHLLLAPWQCFGNSLRSTEACWVQVSTGTVFYTFGPVSTDQKMQSGTIKAANQTPHLSWW